MIRFLDIALNFDVLFGLTFLYIYISQL